MFVNRLGAMIRAVAISFCIMMPALFLAPKADNASSLILIISLLAGSLVWMEYTNTYPSIIEFRDCRPFNRIRFLNGALLILLLSRYLKSVLSKPSDEIQADFFRFIADVTQGFGVLHSLVSPMKLHFSQAVQPALPGMGLVALVLVIATVLPFAIWTFVTNWPMSRNDFNVWTNLPFLEPNKSPNLAARLRASGFLMSWLVWYSLCFFLLLWVYLHPFT